MKQQLQQLIICILLLFAATATKAQYTLLPIAGNDTSGYYGDGVPARQASLYYPGSICRDAAGNIYIGDGGAGALARYMRVRRIDATTGKITTIAGNGSTAFAGDSVDNAPATTAKLRGTVGLCIDKQGNLLIAGNENRIRKVNLTTGIISTVAGSIMLAPGYAGDGGPATAAQFRSAVDVAVDAANNIYFVDGNAPSVRKVSVATGIVTTVAGTGVPGFSGDGGPATAAQLGSAVYGVYIDTADNIFIADRGNNRIRRVSATTGIITTIAGDPTAATHGDGGPATAAKLAGPARMTMDRQGNLYFVEVTSNAPRVSKIDAATSIITTIAGNGSPFIADTTGDNGPATAVPGLFDAICIDTCGNIFLSGVRHRVRVLVPTVPTDDWLCGLKLTHPTTAVSALHMPATQALHITPNPNNGTCTISIASPANEPVQLTITDITGRVIQQLSGATNKNTELLLSAPPGLYFINAYTPSGRCSGKIMIE